jgi:hypothetical protein
MSMSAVGHTISGVPVGQQQVRRTGVTTLHLQQQQHHQQQQQFPHKQGVFDAQLLRAALASSGVDTAAQLVLMAANAAATNTQAPASHVSLSGLSSASLSTNSAATTSTGSPFFCNTASSVALTPRDSGTQSAAHSNSMVRDCSSPASLALLNSMAGLDLNSLAASMSHQQQLQLDQQNVLQGMMAEGVPTWFVTQQQQLQGGATWDMLGNALQPPQQ